jgi:hypothetical protein
MSVWVAGSVNPIPEEPGGLTFTQLSRPPGHNWIGLTLMKYWSCANAADEMSVAATVQKARRAVQPNPERNLSTFPSRNFIN